MGDGGEKGHAEADARGEPETVLGQPKWAVFFCRNGRDRSVAVAEIVMHALTAKLTSRMIPSVSSRCYSRGGSKSQALPHPVPRVAGFAAPAPLPAPGRPGHSKSAPVRLIF